MEQWCLLRPTDDHFLHVIRPVDILALVREAGDLIVVHVRCAVAVAVRSSVVRRGEKEREKR